MKEYFKEHNIEENLKTISYKITDHYRRDFFKVKENNKEIAKYKDVFDGYIVTQIVRISMPIDVLMATELVTTKTIEQKISIDVKYYLKNASQFQNEVITQALKEAERKALVIAECFNKNSVSCNIADYVHNSFDNYSRNTMVFK